MIQSIRLVIFDFDGTIANTGITVLKILNTLRAELGKPILQFSDISPNISLGGKSLIKRALGSEVNHQLYLERFRLLYLNDHLEGEDLYPGVKNFIQCLLDSNIVNAICSNKPKKLLEKSLIRHGLVDCFQYVYGDDGVVPKKPSPAAVNSIMRSAGMTPDQVVFVGDSAIDQQTAKNAKVRFFFHEFGYDDGVKRDKTDYNFHYYYELERAFK
jgi:phosphoglycolate phosphatase